MQWWVPGSCGHIQLLQNHLFEIPVLEAISLPLSPATRPEEFVVFVCVTWKALEGPSDPVLGPLFRTWGAQQLFTPALHPVVNSGANGEVPSNILLDI